MICAAPPGSAWNGFTSNRNDWKVSVSKDQSALPASATDKPCISTSAFRMDGSEHAEKIWGHQAKGEPKVNNNNALFTTTVTDGCGSAPNGVGQSCFESAFHTAKS